MISTNHHSSTSNTAGRSKVEEPGALAGDDGFSGTIDEGYDALILVEFDFSAGITESNSRKVSSLCRERTADTESLSVVWSRGVALPDGDENVENQSLNAMTDPGRFSGVILSGRVAGTGTAAKGVGWENPTDCWRPVGESETDGVDATVREFPPVTAGDDFLSTVWILGNCEVQVSRKTDAEFNLTVTDIDSVRRLGSDNQGLLFLTAFSRNQVYPRELGELGEHKRTKRVRGLPTPMHDQMIVRRNLSSFSGGLWE